MDVAMMGLEQPFLLQNPGSRIQERDRVVAKLLNQHAGVGVLLPRYTLLLQYGVPRGTPPARRVSR